LENVPKSTWNNLFCPLIINSLDELVSLDDTVEVEEVLVDRYLNGLKE